MKFHVLITGGAGFIGSHLADELLKFGYKVRVLDNLSSQVHGEDCRRPLYLSPDVELIVGDVCSPDITKRALKGIDAVFHFAAMVGVGQSMYEIRDYVRVNDFGTANLLHTILENPVERLIAASSMSIYGEGIYVDSEGAVATPRNRTMSQLQRGEWELTDNDGRPLRSCKTPETKQPNLASIYALNKYNQEQMSLIFGKAYRIPTVALRFFNVFGTRQSLSNPYTGVLAIFASRLLNNNRPIVYEDGMQLRDFVHVGDVARACRLALEVPEAAGQALNIGSGNSYRIKDIGTKLAEILGKQSLSPDVTQRFRFGDIRHCYADTSLAHRILGFEPTMSLEDGLIELADWLARQSAVDKFEEAGFELMNRGLTA